MRGGNRMKNVLIYNQNETNMEVLKIFLAQG